MPVETFSNGESLGSVRQKVNDNFTDHETRIADLESKDPDCHFHNAPVPIVSSASTWTTIDSFSWDLVGGVYNFDIVIYFVGSATNQDFQLRFLLDGSPVGEEFSKEPKDPDDTVIYNSFNEYAIPAGMHTVELQAQMTGGTMTVNRFRARAARFCFPDP